MPICNLSLWSYHNKMGHTTTRWAIPQPVGPYHNQMGHTTTRWAIPQPEGSGVTRSCDVHRSLPLHQVLQLLAGLATRTTNTSRVSTLGRRRDAHRTLRLLGSNLLQTMLCRLTLRVPQPRRELQPRLKDLVFNKIWLWTIASIEKTSASLAAADAAEGFSPIPLFPH